MKTTWIDFKGLRAKLDFARVLEHYGVEIKRAGKQHHGFCPLPNHNGKRNSPSFSANLERGIFQCFGCSAKGNVLEFAGLMEKIDLKDGTALREVALKLQQRFCPELESNQTKTNARPPEKPSLSQEGAPQNRQAVVINEPLDFELQGLDAEHPYLLGRGFTPETIRHFGLGYCSRGLLKNRVAIPLYDDANGAVVGYAGRVADDATINEENPRYRFPGKREREGRVFEFHKSLFLYNGSRVRGPLEDLIVVESFTAVWWLHQNGLPDVVATMGADCSDRQAELIVERVKPQGHVWILADGDPAGERLAESLLIKVSPHRFTRWVRLREGTQPTDLSREVLRTLFS